jgi:hypothetical protein
MSYLGAGGIDSPSCAETKGTIADCSPLYCPTEIREWEQQPVKHFDVGNMLFFEDSKAMATHFSMYRGVEF